MLDTMQVRAEVHVFVFYYWSQTNFYSVSTDLHSV